MYIYIIYIYIHIYIIAIIELINLQILNRLSTNHVRSAFPFQRPVVSAWLRSSAIGGLFSRKPMEVLLVMLMVRSWLVL